ncbi:hypothetical protein SESBI_12320 [Sesbania bispinosa]|nr:hypothetical protein SESBI_12320 [Sesbania bispinosa]
MPAHVVSAGGNAFEELVGGAGNRAIHVKRPLYLVVILSGGTAAEAAGHVVPPPRSATGRDDEPRRMTGVAGEEGEPPALAAERVSGRKNHGGRDRRKRIHDVGLD